VCTMRRLRFLTVFVLLTAACSSSGNDVDISLLESEVDVSVFEWGMGHSPSSVSSGRVTFIVTNDGTKGHELVIVKDVAAADLPTEQLGYVATGEIPEGAGATRASEEGWRFSASSGGGPPHISTSGHKSAPLGHTTVPPSARTLRKISGSRFRSSNTGPIISAETSRSTIDPSVSVSRR